MSECVFKVGETYKTKSGLDAKVVAVVNTPADEFAALVCLVETESGTGVSTYSIGGQYIRNGHSPRDLVQPEPPFTLDEPVMVRDADQDKWEKRYYAACIEGKHHTWPGGVTSWTYMGHADLTMWNQCRRPTVEELAKRAKA